MLTAILTYRPIEGIAKAAEADPDVKRLRLEPFVAKYQAVPGLLRKTFLAGGPDGRVGGVYEWRNRAAAQAFYTPQWRAELERTGASDISLIMFDHALTVDNINAAVIWANPL